MDGEDFYEELLKNNMTVEYIKRIEKVVPFDMLIKIRTNYLMSTPTSKSDNLTSDAGLSYRTLSDNAQEKNSKIIESVKIKVENEEILSEKGDDDDLVFPKESKFFIDSEPEESSNENLSADEPKSKRRKMKETSQNGIKLEIKAEIEEPTTDSNRIENEESSSEIVSNLINSAVIMENIFNYLPLTDLLSFRTVSTDWNQKIIFHLDKKNVIRDLSLENLNIEKFISLMKSSKQIPFTKFNLEYLQENNNIQDLITICGSSIKHLTIAVSDFKEKLSRFLPNLESLHLVGDLENNSKDDIILFSKLRNIKYTPKTNDTMKVFPTFWKSAPNLNKLEVTNFESIFEKYFVTDLLAAGKLVNITKLHLNTLERLTFKAIFKAASTTGLSLEEFCVDKIDERINLDDLTKFLSTQGKSLKKLEIRTTCQSPRQSNLLKLHQLVLKNLIALTSLSLSIANNGVCPLTENSLEDLPNLVQITIPEVSPWMAEYLSSQFSCSTVTKIVVEKIVCGEKASKQNVIKSLGIMFPSVKSLKLSHASPECVEDVTMAWPALKHLKVMLTNCYYSLNDIHSVFPSLVDLKDLETLLIAERSSESKSTREHRFSVRFENGIQSLQRIL